MPYECKLRKTNVNKTEDVPFDCHSGASANRACQNREEWVCSGAVGQGGRVTCALQVAPILGLGGNAASPKNRECHHGEWVAVLEVVSDRVPCNGRRLARTEEVQVD